MALSARGSLAQAEERSGKQRKNMLLKGEQNPGLKWQRGDKDRLLSGRPRDESSGPCCVDSTGVGWGVVGRQIGWRGARYLPRQAIHTEQQRGFLGSPACSLEESSVCSEVGDRGALIPGLGQPCWEWGKHRAA